MTSSNILPFYNLVDFDLNTELSSCKERITRLMDNHNLKIYIENTDWPAPLQDNVSTCKYYTEDDYNQ